MILLTLKEADMRLGLRPGTLANEFYFGRLSDSLAEFIGGKRAIPETNLGSIAAVLRSAGRLVQVIDEAAEGGRKLAAVIEQAADNGRKLSRITSPANVPGK